MAPSPPTTLESGTHTVLTLMEGFKKRSPEEPLGFYDLEVNDFHAFIYSESMLLKFEVLVVFLCYIWCVFASGVCKFWMVLVTFWYEVGIL